MSGDAAVAGDDAAEDDLAAEKRWFSEFELFTAGQARVFTSYARDRYGRVTDTDKSLQAI
jgi:hypothetical protein